MGNEKSELMNALKELGRRRVAAGADAQSHLDRWRARAEVTTREDIDLLNHCLQYADEFSLVLGRLRESVWSEFTNGLRCSVCGRTERQNAEIGYNCTEEC